MSREYTVKEAGYAFMYISNENPTHAEVYFDDVTMTYTPTNIIQYNDYYPFGLSASTSWTREGSKNDFLYNAGSELNKASGWYDLPYRNYDAALGRFMQVDPMATATHDLSAFHFGMNNPVYFNDPNGDLPISWDQLEAEQQYYANMYSAAYSYYNSWGNDLTKIQHGPRKRNVGPEEFIEDALQGHGGSWSNGVGTFYETDYDAFDYLAFEEYHKLIDHGNVQDRYEWEVGYRVVEKEKQQESCCGWQYDIPVWGAAAHAGDSWQQGHYFDALAWELNGLIEMAGMGALYKMAATQAAKLAANLFAKQAAKNAGNIALGVREHLGRFAKMVGGSTWETWGTNNFKVQFLETINNPANKIHFNLDGVGNVWKAVGDGAKGFGQSQHVTSWELYQIYSNPSVLQRTIFYLDGKVVTSPF